MNKQQLANKIWESANKMRSKIEAGEYKDYILGFIFYKFLSEHEEQELRSIGYTDDTLRDVSEKDTETVEYIQKNLGYFIAYDNLFSTWLSLRADFDVSNVRDALSAFERLISQTHKKLFHNIFQTLSTGLSKLGDSAGNQTRAVRDLIGLIKDIPMDGRQDYDVLGFIYEYLISNFAANAGKKAGEFYTPHEVSVLMSEIIADHLKDSERIEIYDPTSGSGSLLINIGKSVSKYRGNSDCVKYYAQEWKENTYNLTRMNLVMRGIEARNIVTRCGDTLEEDWPYFEEEDPDRTYRPLYVDAVVSNPPYSQHWEPSGHQADVRYKKYGLAPASKADFAFLLHDLYHIKREGIMTIVLPHGVLFRGGEEGEIRKNLIENYNIDTIIGLPANIFFGTSIPTIIMVLKQQRDNTDVLFIDASKGYEKSGKSNRLRACDIKKIADTVRERPNKADKYSRLVSRDDIRLNEYNLNIPRYVDSSERAESWDICATMFGGIPKAEAESLSSYWEAFPGLKKKLFTGEDESYLHLSAEDIKGTVLGSPDVKRYISDFNERFDDFEEYLTDKLIRDVENVNAQHLKDEISDEIFRRLSDERLADKYEAYQIFDDIWSYVSTDLEIIQSEGRTSINKVDPNMVMKKKNGRDIEVQEGYVGHILPFEMIQGELLDQEVNRLKGIEDDISGINGRYSELIEELPEEERDREIVNEDKTAFVFSEVSKILKNKDAEGDVLKVLEEASGLNAKEKKLKKELKEGGNKLHLDTKRLIEEMSDEMTMHFLKKKWVAPLCSGLRRLPDAILADFVKRLEELASKYATTLSDVENNIKVASMELSGMLGELEGGSDDMRGISELMDLFGARYR